MKWWIIGALASTGLSVYLLSGSGRVGPPYRDEALTAGPAPLMLLSQPSVQKELRLTKRQIDQIKATTEKQFAGRRPDPGAKGARPAARMGRKHQEHMMEQLLDSTQVGRLHQIILQQQGGLALANKPTADELALTGAQRRKVDAILEKLIDQLNDPSDVPRGPERWQRAQEARQSAGESMLAILTTDQQSHWNELKGDAFTGEITMRPPGFRRAGTGTGASQKGRRRGPAPPNAKQANG
jgi:hypothetical protein